MGNPAFVIGYDDNLGLPADFCKTFNSHAIAFHKIDELILAFRAKALNTIFIPTGTLPYLNPEDRIVAQATFDPTNGLFLKSVFSVNANIPVQSLPNHTIGRVNQFCTTSYWAPLIYLKQYFEKGTILKFVNTNGFRDMLINVAEKEIDAAMVWDIILSQNPSESNKVHSLFEKTDLPTPVLVADAGFPEAIISKIINFRSSSVTGFFNGYTEPDLTAIKNFSADMLAAKNHFNVVIEEKIALI